MDSLADVMIRIDDDLEPEQLDALGESLRGADGIVSACPIADPAPAILVVFDAACLRSSDIVERIARKGVAARLIDQLPGAARRAEPDAALRNL